MQNRTPSQPPRHEQDRHTTTTQQTQGKRNREDQQHKGTSQDKQHTGIPKGHRERGGSVDHE